MAGQGARRVRRSEKQWVGILRRFESSGLSTRVFCRREGLSSSSFQRWRRRAGSAARPRFVELIPAKPAAVDAAGDGPGGWSVELALPNGLSIRLRG